MKMILLVGAIAGSYCYILLQLTNSTTAQVVKLHHTYQYVADGSEELVQ